MKRVLFALACLPLAAPLASAATPRISADAIVQAVVRDLGAERYDVRERATELVRRIGQPALQALEKAAESDDPEIRVRARDVLGDVRLGIGPNWPADIVLLVRHYDNMQEHERSNAIYRIASLGAKGVPFLVKVMEAGSPNEANWACNALQRPAAAELHDEVIRLIREPKNNALTRALSWARSQRGQAVEGVGAVATRQAIPFKPNQATEDALQAILAKLAAGKAQEALAAAEALAKTEPDDLRPLYLQADAMVPLNRDKEAIALREKALALSPDKELPHYLAACLLTDTGRYRLAVKEWQRVVQIEPNDGPCDANAHLSLGAIHSANGLFEAAAQYFEKALQIIAKAKDQENVKATTSALQMEVDRLRQRAASFPVSPDAAVEDAIPASELQLDIRVVPRQGKPEDLQQALAATAAQFQIAVALPDIAVLDLPSASVKYDKAAKALLVLLHDAPACPPLPCDLKGPNARVALHLPGCTYIYQVDAAGGAAERLAKFDKDYTVALKPGLKVSAFANPVVRINGMPHDWAKAAAGIPFARLPESFELIVEGSAPLGRRMTVRATIEAVEPAPEPPKPDAPPKPKA
ncbi:MAG: tetratricopeptide repeat protein [Planctomycetes bacterium]|nr:tetratricopeptide repeat protein [Planctomycetota bacterium]